MRQKVFAIVMFAYGATLFAQNGNQKIMSLKECIEFSLRSHISNSIRANDIEIAREKTKEVWAGYLPQLNSSIAVDDNTRLPTTVIPPGILGPRGASVALGAQYSTNVIVQVDQMIYDQTLICGIQANKANEQIAELKKRKNDEDLMYITARSYYDLLVLREHEKLLEENEQKYIQLLPTLQMQYEKGVAKKIDYDLVKVGLKNIQSQVDLVQTQIQLATNNLKNAMGMPRETPLIIADSVNLSSEVTLPGCAASDINCCLDYEIQSESIMLQEIDFNRKEASFLPTLSFYARYGSQALASDFSKSYDQWYSYSAIGLRLNVPLFSGMRRLSQINQSRLSLLNAQENLKLFSENLRLQEDNSYAELYGSYTSLANDRENRNLAKEVLETTSLQYQKGVVPFSAFLNAEYSYKDAEGNYITSLLNYLKARISFEKVNGTITEYVNQL